MQVRLVWLMDYGGPYPGSSIPLLRAALDEARGRGWEPLVVFGEDAVDRPWFAELRADGYRVEITGTSRAQTFATSGRSSNRGRGRRSCIPTTRAST